MEIFKHLDLYIVPTNIPSAILHRLKQSAVEHGAILANESTCISCVVTALRTFHRIQSHLNGLITKYHFRFGEDVMEAQSESGVPVVGVSWLRDSISQLKRLPLKNYLKGLYMPPLSISTGLHTSAVSDVHLSSSCIFRNQQVSKEVFNMEEYYSENESGNIILKTRRRLQEELLPEPKRICQSTSGSETRWDNRTSSQLIVNHQYLDECEECRKIHPLNHHNEELADLFKILVRHRDLFRDESRQFSNLSYARAMAAIISYPKTIETEDEVIKLKHIGQKSARKIKEYLTVGYIQEVENIKCDETFRVVDIFAKVFGVGPKTAIKWYNTGYRTIKEVREDSEFMETLTIQQQMGLEVFSDFMTPFDRAQADRIIDYIVHQTQQFDSRYTLTAVGGYRRGKTTLGDLDLIISYSSSASVPTTQPHVADITSFDIIDVLVKRLKAEGVIKYILSFTNKQTFEGHRHRNGSPKNKIKSMKEQNRRGKIKYKGNSGGGFDKLEKCFVAIKIPGDPYYRQVDLIMAHPKEYPTAVLGWTGSTIIERSLRRVAEKMGFSFSSDGLYSFKTGDYVPVKSEKEIWDLLGLQYLEPWHRNAG